MDSLPVIDLNQRWRTAFVRVLAESALDVGDDEAMRVAECWFRSSALLEPEDAAWMYLVHRAGEHTSLLFE